MKKIVAIVLSFLVFGSGVFAADMFKSIQASLREDISVELNGKTVSLTDSTGHSIAPISYNGTTYLPVRAVAENLNLDVKWDGETKTVKLSSKNTSTVTSQKATQTPTISSTDGKIKGNKNTKKYHVPGGRYYNTVKEENAVYFDTEDDAVKAGYVRAKQ